MTIYARYSDGNLYPAQVTGVPVPVLHVVWRDYRNSTGLSSDPNFQGNDPDIYYAYCPIILSAYPDSSGQYPPQLTIGANQQINQADGAAWQTEPPKQFDPAIVAWSCTDVELRTSPTTWASCGRTAAITTVGTTTFTCRWMRAPTTT